MAVVWPVTPSRLACSSDSNGIARASEWCRFCNLHRQTKIYLAANTKWGRKEAVRTLRFDLAICCADSANSRLEVSSQFGPALMVLMKHLIGDGILYKNFSLVSRYALVAL